MKKAISLVISVVYAGSRLIASAGSIALVVMASVIVVDVALRFVFNQPLLGAFEIAGFMLCVVVFCGIAQAEVTGSHIAVYIIFDRFPQRVRSILSVFITFVSFGILSVISWRSVSYARELWTTGATSGVLRIPYFPFVYVIALGCALFSVVLLLKAIQFVAQEKKK